MITARFFGIAAYVALSISFEYFEEYQIGVAGVLDVMQ